MNESDRAACYEAEAELEAQSPWDSDGFDYEEMERVFLDDPKAGGAYLAKHTALDEAEAESLLRRIYRW